MLERSLGAGTFVQFWQYWNPVFGYYLGKHIYAPSHRVMPMPLAFVLTFIVSGAIHDLVSTLVRGSVTFLFTPWFLLLSLGVLLGKALRLDFSNYSWPIRALVNISYIAIGMILTLMIKAMLAIP